MHPHSIRAQKRGARIVVRIVVAATWVWATALALHCTMVWESSPGVASRQTPAHGSGLKLIFVAHTYCPCTSVALRNLMSLSGEALAKLRPEIVLTGPDATPESTAPNVILASKIAHVTIRYGHEAQALSDYGARTSGQCFLFDKQGKLVFSGGLTSGRGVEGECAGMEAISHVLADKACQLQAPVFGCPLTTPGE